MKKIVLLSASFFAFFLSSCSDMAIPGCTDPHAENYNSYANESNGTCDYRYAGNVKVNNYPANNSSGNAWDLTDGPDLYVVFTKANSNTWDYSTATSQNVQTHVELTNTNTSTRFTNELWKYELRDDDGAGLYEVVSSGTFNPMQDRYATEITLSTGSTTMYFVFDVN